jgi:glycosyltransferase involved in cell wall biosynthesis
MNVALVHTRLMYRGGLESRLFLYMKWLLENGHQVTVIVYRVQNGLEITESVRVIKIQLFYIPKVFRQTVFDRKLVKVFQQNNFDFVLSLGRTSHHDAVLLPGNHLGYMNAIGQEKLRLTDKLQITLDRKAYFAPGVVMACSKMMRYEVVRFYNANPDKIKVLYPPLDTDKFNISIKSKQSIFRKKFGISESKKSFLLVSSAHGRKGLPMLLEIFKKLDSDKYELIVAGEGKTSSLDNVLNVGFIKETHELYSAVDFTILPANYEPYGQVVAESIACGTPVIISDKVGAKEIVGPQEGIVVSSFDPAKWVDILKDITPGQFKINPDFALANKLSIDDHMARIFTLNALM